MDWWWAYLVIGVSVGFLAGLLGIGGGMIMVPMLVFVFTAKAFPADHMMHLSLATSMATIVFTSISSVRAHHLHGAVDWRVARAMAPGIVAGALAATLVAGFVPTRALAVFFALFMLYASLQMFFEVKPKAARQLPGATGLFGVGAGIGALSSVLAAGGAFLSIPFLARCNVPLKRAIGTAAANGFPIAVAGTVGYVLNGLRVSGLPDGSLGYVYLPALAIIVAASMPAAPLGAKLAHRLPVKRLRIVFALMLLALALRMLANLW
ncbi:MAG TPA: sulfite exporter TauE/SafE family protein [Burkholderiales bacterium]